MWKTFTKRKIQTRQIDEFGFLVRVTGIEPAAWWSQSQVRVNLHKNRRNNCAKTRKSRLFQACFYWLCRPFCYYFFFNLSKSGQISGQKYKNCGQNLTTVFLYIWWKPLILLGFDHFCWAYRTIYSNLRHSGSAICALSTLHKWSNCPSQTKRNQLSDLPNDPLCFNLELAICQEFLKHAQLTNYLS